MKARGIWGEQVKIQIIADSISSSVRARNEKLKERVMSAVMLILQKNRLSYENPHQQECALAMKTEEEPITCLTVVSDFSCRENE